MSRVSTYIFIYQNYSNYILSSSRKIVWSKFGSLAYITADGKGIGILNLCLRPKDGTWVQNLQIDSLLPDHISKIFKGRKLCHIIWSHTGHELLVVDVFGRLAIFTVFITINRLAASKTWTAEPEDNLNALVGVTWLIAKRLVRLHIDLYQSQ
jgi:mediator of RNA polymerase II transcription subunit 16